MGYAVIMFVALMIMSVVMITAVTYGVMKDNEVAPLKAENNYAERGTGKAQTGLTIYNTCLSSENTSANRYTKAQGSETFSGPYSLYLTVRNNGSTVLDSRRATVFYNTSYSTFTVINSTGNVWAPATNISMKVSDNWINTPDSPEPGDALRLLVASENGVSTIAPTSPTNFTATKINNSYVLFNWNASYDKDGIANYRLNYIDSSGASGECPPRDYTIQTLPGNINNLTFYNDATNLYYLTAIDIFQNEGIQSRTIKCTSSSNCDW